MTVFYRKYRPQKLSELCGQEEISKTLLEQLGSGKIGHGYLFYGPKGTGKTSTARILAKAINCDVYRKQETRNKKQETTFGEPCNKCGTCLSFSDGSALDLIEIDAASNRGIDEIRDLREKIKISPVSAPFKVYIIDEAHMLTTEAFNALLKTLEEPPAHVVIILATTEFAELPPTIVSRLQKFGFKRATKENLKKAVLKIAREEKIKLGEDAMDAIAEAADGSFRDAVSILDQVSSQDGEVNGKDISAIARVSGWNMQLGLAQFLADAKLKEAVLEIEKMVDDGVDFELFVRQFVLFLEKVLFLKIGVSVSDFDVDESQVDDLTKLAQKFTFERIEELMRLMLVSESEMKVYPIAHMPIVLAFCKFVGDGGEEEAEEAEEAKVSTPIESGSKDKNMSKVLDASSGQVGEIDEKMKTVDDVVGPKVRLGAKGDKVPEIPMDEVEKKWSEFLNRVKMINAHVVALLRATKPTSFDGQSLVMEVFYRFHKDKLEEPKILKMLDSTMEETYGVPIRIKFKLASRETKPTSIIKQSNVVDFKAEELEKIAQEIFSK